MSDLSINDKHFVDQAESLILENVSNEQFGVSELAEAMNTSRSNLLRKIKQHTGLSASQFIRQVRLEKGMELLSQTSLTVSEVSYKVGFGSTSYFIKCFREHYGYPPGEAGKRGDDDQGKGASAERKRQLAAIMFTDIQGYTALMQEDEYKAIAYRQRHREVFESTTRKYNGRILQYYGDGTLSTFPSAIDAVHCGIEMQLAFTKEEPNIPIRVGIHLGDILVSDQDIIGDGVNIAARVESLASTGSVYVSDKVYDEIKNQPDLITASMGVHTLKNVAKPIEVYTVSNNELGGVSAVESRVTRTSKGNSTLNWTMIAGAAILLVIITYFSGLLDNGSDPESLAGIVDKSIAVLPYKNESSDSSNLYFVNGLMESTLSNLQKIKDLRVISRSSVERYRNSDKTIPEMADELKVKYFVAGSGQKVGDQVLLNIQLIEAGSDRQIWAEQYNREFVDIFELQNEVARKIVGAIEAIVTPSELELIEKKPTENLQAYDYFLQGLDPFYSRTNEGLNRAIELFEKALEQDPEFARAYANIAISYYLLEMFQVEKQYTEKINTYADKALLYDPKSASSLIAKAFYYVQTKEYDLALPHLEKALEYNPNSSLAVQMLADYYFRMVPNPDKYLEYALKGVQLNVGSSDSITQSYIYVQLSNALVSAGFVDEAVTYIDMALDYDANNYYAPYLKAMILFGRDGNAGRTRSLLLKEWNKDTSRLDILQDFAKMYYVEEKYDSAYFFFRKFVRAREAYGMNVYLQENVKIALAYKKTGNETEAKKLFDEYAAFCEADQSPYRSINMAYKYAYEEQADLAMEQLSLFSELDNYQYWFLLIEHDPLLQSLKSHPEFQPVVKKIKDRFWKNQELLKEKLKNKGLI